MRKVWLSLVSLIFLVVGCSPQPPAPPTVDPVTSPTSVLTQTITGFAKWGSTVKIAGGAQEVSGVADPYAGRFAIAVTLNPNTTNDLSLTATDATGTSQPTKVSIVTPAPGVSIRMMLSAQTMKAGGSVMATVEVLDVNGQNNGMVVAPTITAGPSGNGALNVSGTASPFTLSGTLSGVYTVTAQLSANISVSQTLTVTAADPAVLTLALGTSATPLTAVNTATAGTQLVYVYTVVDMYGNQIPQPLVTVTTNMPGAVVSPVDTQGTDTSGNTYYQGMLVNFVKSSNTPWNVTAHVAGTTLTQTKAILIGADQTALVARLTLSNNITQVNNPLNYKVVVSDGFGNTVTTGLGAMSVTLTPTPTTAATCAPTACASATQNGTLSVPVAGVYQVAVAFAGTPTVVGDSVYISVINAPIPPTVTIVSPLNTDVFGTLAQIPVQVQINYANNNNNSVLYFANGAFNQSNTIAGLGQTVSSGAALFNLNPGGFNNAQPTVESLIIVATDGTTGASTTKTVSFTIDIFKNISPQLGRPTAVKVTQSTFVAATALLAPMGLSILPATNTLYIADSGTSTVFASSLAGPFPVAAGNLTAVKNNLNGVSDAQLQPDAGGVAPPATYQGIFAGSAANANFVKVDAAGVVTNLPTATPLTGIRNVAYQASSTLGAMTIAQHLFATRPAAGRVEVTDLAGADLTGGGGGITMNGQLVEPWGVAYVQNGTTSIRLFVTSNNGGGDRIYMCDISGAINTWSARCNGAGNVLAINAAVPGGSQLQTPRALAISPGGTKLYAVSAGGGFNQGRVLSYDISGITCAAGTCTCATPGCNETTVVRNLQFPNGLAFDGATAPNLYVSDTFLRAVAQIQPGTTAF